MYPQDSPYSLKTKDGKYYSVVNNELTLSDTPNEFKRQPTIINPCDFQLSLQVRASATPKEEIKDKRKTFVFFEPEPIEIFTLLRNEKGILAECFYSCDNDSIQLDFMTWHKIMTNNTFIIKSVK